MKILIIPDKFKGSLTATEVIQAIKQGIQAIDPAITSHHILASDGGDGFLEAVSHYLDPTLMSCKTVDPLGRPMQGSYLFHKAKKTAYIELAKTSGLELLSEKERNVMETSTYGSGMQIRHAIAQGAEHIYLGLGGSATNDVGTGIATALGYTFYNVKGAIAIPTGKDLNGIISIDCSTLKNTADVSFFAVNDVQNPLYGEDGAAHTYAKQKGATMAQIQQLDKGLRNISTVVKEQLNKDIAWLPGSGAAGGTAYGLKAFLNANFIAGANFILDLAGFSNIINTQKIDIIITGEGKIDQQTQNGKLIQSITAAATGRNIPVVAICGKLDLDATGVKALGLKAAVEIHDKTQPNAYSFKHAAMLIRENVKYLFEGMI